MSTPILLASSILGRAEPAIAALEAKGWSPDWILLTNNHNDHVGGVGALVERYGAKVAGAAADASRLPPLDAALKPGSDWDFGSQIVEIFDTPGHTVGHIAYHFPKAKALFAGDTLFALGCGRLFEGHGAADVALALGAGDPAAGRPRSIAATNTRSPMRGSAPPSSPTTPR